MEKFASFIVKNTKPIMAVFIIATLISAILSLDVKTNYNIEDYLPKDSGSAVGMNIIKDDFKEDLPSLEIMLKDVSILEVLACKDKIANIPHITSVMWLDDITGRDVLLSEPLEVSDMDITEAYYKDKNALITVAVEPGYEQAAIDKVYEITGEENAVSGTSLDKKATQEMSASETMQAMIILIPVVIIILALTTSSWLEPLVYLIPIGVAIIINMGTNVIFSDISFMTKAISPILQLAVSLDYAIFLMHSFRDYQKDYDTQTAMQKAIQKSVSAVFGSAATTVIGFLALVFMRFEIGMDLGINLVKGVILSFLSIMVFLPALVLSSIKLLDKTTHRAINTEFGKIGKWLAKLRIPLLIISIIVILPSFLAKNNIVYQYGMGNVVTSERIDNDKADIEQTFGKTNQMVVIIPRTDPGKEAVLGYELEKIDGVTQVISYETMVGSSIPEQYIEENIGTFKSDNWSRIILYTDLPDESERTFASIEKIYETTGSHYDEYYVAGQSVAVYDIKTVVTHDNVLVTVVAVLGIFGVIMLTFRSISIPFILVLTIESAIWINLAITYFQGQPLNYIGFLVINTVQLGATVDYAILLTDRYVFNRRKLLKREAMEKTIGTNISAVMVSAITLSFAGFTLFMTSSNPIVGELGILLGRGTILSFAMVATVLPALLILFDFIIRKTTFRVKFLAKDKSIKETAKKDRGENK